MTKVCNRCGEEKPFAAFYRKRSRADGHTSHCKECLAAYSKEYRGRREERQAAYSRAYYLRRGPAVHRQLGITPDIYAEMLARQNGVCAICEQPCSSGKRLALDHSHETGRPRALLCGSCNLGLGKFGDDPARLRAAANYLDQMAHAGAA